MKLKKMLLSCMVILCTTYLVTGCTDEKMDNKAKEENKGNCTIVECMKTLEATNTIEEINNIIGFESTIDAMIGSDPIWKFDSKNWISFKDNNGSITIKATIDKESIKNDNVTLPSQKELQELLNNGITYEELVEKLGAEGILESKTNTSVGYVWADKHGQRLGATINNESGKCTVASYR